MKKNRSVRITMLEMFTQFLKHLRKKDVNVYRKVACAKHFVSVGYRISPIRRVLLVIEDNGGDLTCIGANV